MTRFPLLLLPLLPVTACAPSDPLPTEPDQTEAVRPAPVETKPELPEWSGVVTSRKSEVIPAPFQGRIKTMSVSPNQRVAKGTPIAVFDDTDLKSKIAGLVAQENAARAEAGAAGALASAASKRAKAAARAYHFGAGSRMEISTTAADASSNGAQANAAMKRGGVARAEREVLERQLQNATLTAPLDGIVMMVKAKEGESVQQGAPIARVFDPKDLLIRFAVPKDQRTLVKLGQRVELSIEGVEQPVWATVERMADEEAPINFTVVEADIDDSKLRPDEVRVASVGRVRIADARGGKQ